MGWFRPEGPFSCSVHRTNPNPLVPWNNIFADYVERSHTSESAGRHRTARSHPSRDSHSHRNPFLLGAATPRLSRALDLRHRRSVSPLSLSRVWCRWDGRSCGAPTHSGQRAREGIMAAVAARMEERHGGRGRSMFCQLEPRQAVALAPAPSQPSACAWP